MRLKMWCRRHISVAGLVHLQLASLDFFQPSVQVPIAVPLGRVTRGADRLDDTDRAALSESNDIVGGAGLCVSCTRTMTGLAAHALFGSKGVHRGSGKADGLGCCMTPNTRHILARDPFEMGHRMAMRPRGARGMG